MSDKGMLLCRVALWCLSLISVGLYITAVSVESSVKYEHQPFDSRPRAQCLTCNPSHESSHPILNQLSQISFFTKINFAVDIAIFLITSANLMKSDDSGATDFLVSIGVFCKVYLIPYVVYNFLSGSESPAENITYLLIHDKCGTLKNCLHGNVARILFSCIVVFVIMLMALPSFIASFGTMYFVLVRYFSQSIPMVSERVDDLPSYSALFPENNGPCCKLLKTDERDEQTC